MWVLLALAAALFRVLRMIGVYLLNVNRAHISWWTPLTVLFTDRAPLGAPLGVLPPPSVVTIKRAMQLSDPYTGTLGGYLAASLLVTPLVVVTSRPHFALIPRYWKEFLGMGLFTALTTVSQGGSLTS